MGLTRPLLDVVVATVQRFPDFGDFRQIPGEGVFHKVICRAATPQGKLGEA
jgi:hypothetical protein